MLERANVLSVGLVLLVALAAPAAAQRARVDASTFAGRHTLEARAVGEELPPVRVVLLVERDGRELRVTREVAGGPTLRGAGRLVEDRLEVDFSQQVVRGVAQLLPGVTASGERRVLAYRAAYRRVEAGLVGRGELPGLARPTEPQRVEEATASGEAPTAPPPASSPLEVVAVTVTNGLPIQDARPPHLVRELGQERPSLLVPAALPLRARARLAIVLSTERAVPAAVLLEARLDGAVVAARRVEPRETRGQPLELELAHDLGSTLGIRQLDLAWTVDGAPAGRTPLRLYRTWAAPVPGHGGAKEPAPLTLVHLENACRWAEGTSALVGSGPASIPWQVNDRLRHYVHPDDLAQPPLVPDYPAGARRPANYAFLPGEVGPTGRALAHVLSPSRDAVEPLLHPQHYLQNYGWLVLDNPRYPGGRSDQQASLLVDVLATLGVPAEVHVIERAGVGRSSGRPVRQHLRTPEGSTYLHAGAEVVLADGSRWLYEQALSRTPGHRAAGPTAELERRGGVLVTGWDEWSYGDYGQRVPRDDLPLTWRGVQADAVEQAELSTLQREEQVEAARIAGLFEAARREEAAGRASAALDGYAAVTRERPSHPTARGLFGDLALVEARRLHREGKAAWFGLNDDEAKFRQAAALIERHRCLLGPEGRAAPELRALDAVLTAELRE